MHWELYHFIKKKKRSFKAYQYPYILFFFFLIDETRNKYLKNDIYRDIYSFSTKRWILVIFRTFKVVSHWWMYFVRCNFCHRLIFSHWVQIFLNTVFYSVIFYFSDRENFMNTLKIEKTKQEAFEKSDTCYSILYLIIVLKLFIFVYLYRFYVNFHAFVLSSKIDSLKIFYKYINTFCK